MLIGALSVAALSPWLLEATGVLPHTIGNLGDALALRSPAGTIDASRFEIAHAIYVVALIGAVGMLARTMARIQREARRASHLQTRHLRQLVPVVAL